MTIHLIDSPAAKAILAGVGSALTFLELALTPHSTLWIIVGAILAAATTLGVYAQPNAGTEKP